MGKWIFTGPLIIASRTKVDSSLIIFSGIVKFIA